MASTATPTEATAILAARVNPPRVNLSELSRQTGLNRARLRALVAGAEATASEMRKLRDALGIPLEAWTKPAAPASGPDVSKPPDDA